MSLLRTQIDHSYLYVWFTAQSFGHLFVQHVEMQGFQDTVTIGSLASAFMLNTIENTVYQYLYL